MNELEKFVDAATIVTKADAQGKITYVNEKFCEISGYSLDESIGRDHNLVNSGTHPHEFWRNMYRTVVKDKKIWNAICVNRKKDGSLYYVDSFIKGDFNEDGKLIGYMSIRQDVTNIYKANEEIKKSQEQIVQINNELKEALEDAENAKMVALNDLDFMIKKSQNELLSIVVRTALWVILGVGLITTGLYVFSILVNAETQIIGSTWSNMFGILLTNAFSIVGTIMGVKYATEKQNN